MKALGLGLAKLILGIIIVGCIAISAVFAFEFGFSKGVGPIHQWAFGLAGAGLDLLKAALPIIAAASIAVGLWGKGAVAWGAYVVLTGMSLWCAFGTTAGQLADRMGNRAAATTERAQKQATLDRLRQGRGQVPAFTPASADTVQAAKDAATAAAEQRLAECTKRGPLCRQREADERTALASLARSQIDLATTERAAALDDQIAVAETALAAVDVRAIEKEADPQAASLSKATGWNVDKITLFSHALFAVGIEIGSGLGLWLLFGHGSTRLPETIAGKQPPATDADDAPVSGTPESSRARFFAEQVHHAADSKIAAGVMFGAYEAWCRDRGIEPMDRYAFGRRAPWVQKKRIGGVIHYMGCGVKSLPASAPQLRVVSSN